MLSYNEAIDYLFNQRPAFERQGAGGYKPGLDTTIALDNLYGNSHRHFKTIHVAGTNGKGSVSSLIAAVLQSQGYKVGLYTSPHFVDFAERIKVNGNNIPHDYVTSWVNDFKSQKITVEPTFFELTTILAFKYFEQCKVDYAVIEVGLGGRLDSTNIITPLLSIITNISLDHTEFLGNTLPEIATEKAGIIKPGIPVIVGEAQGDVRDVITNKASAAGAQATFVQDLDIIKWVGENDGNLTVETKEFGNLSCQLTGEYQRNNIATALAAIKQLRQQGIAIDDEAIRAGFAHVCDLTSLRGRWTIVQQKPLVVCDSGHNIAGITAAMHQLRSLDCTARHLVLGFMADKDLEHILPLLPHDATYYFTQAHTPRALSADNLARMASEHGLKGNCYNDITQAYKAALDAASDTDVVYVGGSMYVLAEFFDYIDKIK